MIEFVFNCSHKKNWTPKPDFGYDFAGIFILVRLKMYTLATLKSKPLPFHKKILLCLTLYKQLLLVRAGIRSVGHR